MLFGDKKLYARARQAKLGKSDLSGPLEDLRLWVNSQYSINVIYVVYDFIDIGPHKDRPRLNLIIETTQDYEQVHKDIFTLKPNIKGSILNKFSRIVAESDSPSNYNTENVHLISDNFSQEAMGRAAEQFLLKESRGVIKSYPEANIWDISGLSTQIVVFYQKEKEITQCQKNGRSAAIYQRCYEAVKGYDEFDYICPENFTLKFDSKENVDKNYNGSMFYYWR